MTDKVHLAVTEVDSKDQADVTLKGDELNIRELLEVTDVDTLLQRALQSNLTYEVGVEVIPRKGLAGVAHKTDKEEKFD